MALHLAGRGVDSVITYKNAADEARAVVAEITARGQRAAALQLDVGASASFDEFVARLRAELERTWRRPRFDYLVNNAGSGLHASIADTTEAQFDELTNIHRKAPFFLP